MAEKALENAFASFSKFGNTKSDGTAIALSQIDKWLKQAGVIGKSLTTTDTAIAFNKFKSKTIDLATFREFISSLCNEKKLKMEEVVAKLVSVMPGTTNTTHFQASSVTDRLTDTKGYTGSHKERFDASGKGRGKEGREDVTDNDGYVSGYKHKDTYGQPK